MLLLGLRNTSYSGCCSTQFISKWLHSVFIYNLHSVPPLESGLKIHMRAISYFFLSCFSFVLQKYFIAVLSVGGYTVLPSTRFYIPLMFWGYTTLCSSCSDVFSSLESSVISSCSSLLLSEFVHHFCHLHLLLASMNRHQSTVNSEWRHKYIASDSYQCCIFTNIMSLVLVAVNDCAK